MALEDRPIQGGSLIPVVVVNPAGGATPDVDVASVTPGTGADNLGKRRGDAAGAADVGVAMMGIFMDDDTHTDVDDGDYGELSLTHFRELRTRDQRAIDLANCNSAADYTVLGNDTGSLANSTNHVFGTGAISFAKVNGAANTVYAGVYKTFTAINLAEIFEAGGFVGLGAYLPAIANVVNVFLRIGTDAANYNCWTWPVASLTAAAWLNLRQSAGSPDYAKNAGNGWNTNAVSYVAFGVEFSLESDTLAGIVMDHVHIVGGRVTSSDINATISSTVNTPNVNLLRVANSAASVAGNGTVGGGTQRVTLASDSTGQVKAYGVCDVFDVTLSLDTNIYADGDVLAATQEITSFFLASGGKAYITGVHLIDEDDQGAAMDILLMNANTDIGTENNANAITDAEGETILAWLDVNTSDYVDWGNFRTVTLKATDAGFYSPGWIEGGAGTSLYIAAITRGGTPTYSASGIKLKISVMYP